MLGSLNAEPFGTVLFLTTLRDRLQAVEFKTLEAVRTA